jgi:hypothetical protein
LPDLSATINTLWHAAHDLQKMTRRRWIADEFSATHAAITADNAVHLARVLRARVGQEFEIVCVPHGRSSSIRGEKASGTLAKDRQGSRATISTDR